MRLTAFESEIVDSILWQVEGFALGRVTKRATNRILRATVRRIRPRLIARSEAAVEGVREADHAIPVQVLCSRILAAANLDRSSLERMLHEWLVSVEVTPSEHRELLRKCGLTSCMPKDWNGIDPLARYRAAGIRFVEIAEEETAP